MVNGVKVLTTPLHSQVSPVAIVMPDKYLKLKKKDSTEDKGQPAYTTAICRGPDQDRLQSQTQMKRLLSLRSVADEEYFQILSTGQSAVMT